MLRECGCSSPGTLSEDGGPGELTAEEEAAYAEADMACRSNVVSVAPELLDYFLRNLPPENIVEVRPGF